MALPTIPKFKPLADASPKIKGILKPVLIGVIVILAAAFGLETTNTDFDLGKIMGGQTLQESKVLRDTSGNILYDKTGNVVTESDKGKAADAYNCTDFANQSEAQNFFTKVGGKSNDLNRLDGDKDGQACESLPKQ